MNKYQRQRSKEIKAMMAESFFSHSQARRRWNRLMKATKRLELGSPCKECRNMTCGKRFKALVFCSGIAWEVHHE